MNNSISIQGNLEANNSSVVLAVDGFNYVVAQVTGTWSGNIAFEGTIDDSNWFAIPAVSIPDALSGSSSSNGGQWRSTISGLFKVRVRATAINSGGASVTIRATV